MDVTGEGGDASTKEDDETVWPASVVAEGGCCGGDIVMKKTGENGKK